MAKGIFQEDTRQLREPDGGQQHKQGIQLQHRPGLTGTSAPPLNILASSFSRAGPSGCTVPATTTVNLTIHFLPSQLLKFEPGCKAFWEKEVLLDILPLQRLL